MASGIPIMLSLAAHSRGHLRPVNVRWEQFIFTVTCNLFLITTRLLAFSRVINRLEAFRASYPALTLFYSPSSIDNHFLKIAPLDCLELCSIPLNHTNILLLNSFTKRQLQNNTFDKDIKLKVGASLLMSPLFLSKGWEDDPKGIR
uniref:Uncharacterized protein n=1 Tax=Strigamia maritima TaxID=126957 RepID=T1JG17_STRMM